MFKNTSTTLLHLKIFSTSSLLAHVRNFCSEQRVLGITQLRDSLEQKRKAVLPHLQPHDCNANNASIYRVPTKFRNTDSSSSRDYQPHFISIGPFHRGMPHLADSERLKLDSLNRVLGLGTQARDDHYNMLSVLDSIEPQARACYSEDVKLSRDEFVEMMLLDGCFIIKLLRDHLKNDNNPMSGSYSPLLPKRWMLPVVRRDLITLENQLPMIILSKIFDETIKNNPEEEERNSLIELAIRFFDPLMPREEALLQQSIKSVVVASEAQQNSFHHLLNVFHSSITLTNEVKRQKEPHMFLSATELREEGIKVRVLRPSQPLELGFHKGHLWIPSLQINNHTGCFFRNMVAYEQCHHDDNCHPDMTAYLFFLDRLINSAEDVGLLHYENIIQHTFGSNKQVAQLVNNLCIGFEYDGRDSYLYRVIEDINTYSEHWWIRKKTRLIHDYFTNVWVGISTVVAALLIYLTLVQTACNAVEAQEKGLDKKTGLWARLTLFLINPAKFFKPNESASTDE